VRPFLYVTIHGACLGLAMDVHVGDLRQPPGRGLIQVLQGSEGPAIEQICGDADRKQKN